MSYFTDFLEEEQALILSIPVRAGVWIGHIDDVGATERDDARERAALEQVIRTIDDRTEPSSFMHEIMDRLLVNRDSWPVWEAQAATVLDDLPAVVALVRSRLPEYEIRLFQKGVYHIAQVVAQAANEERLSGEKEKEGFGARLIGRALDRLSVKTDLSDPENVSDNEKAALKKLLQGLKG